MIYRLLAAVAAAAATAVPALAQPQAAQAPRPKAVTVIHAGTLLAVPGERPRRNATIVVRGNRIAEVRDGFLDVPGARLVDLRTSTVMPGFIDMHVHMRGLDDRLQARLQAPIRDYEDEAYTAQINARRTLLAGFTTVRDLGNNPRLIFSLRDAINQGMFAGPTIVAAGQGISVSGGHGDPRNGLNRDLYHIEEERVINTCNGAADCRRAVRDQISLGAEVIKIAATGGVLSNVAGGLNQQMLPDEMSAIVETARSFGRRVAAHAPAAATDCRSRSVPSTCASRLKTSPSSKARFPRVRPPGSATRPSSSLSWTASGPEPHERRGAASKAQPSPTRSMSAPTPWSFSSSRS